MGDGGGSEPGVEVTAEASADAASLSEGVRAATAGLPLEVEPSTHAPTLERLAAEEGR